MAIDFEHGLRTPAPWRDALIAASTGYLAAKLPRTGAHRLYFDHGSVGLNQFYAPYQRAVDRVAARRGYVQGRDIITRTFPGADHNERAWNARADVPLILLLGRGR